MVSAFAFVIVATFPGSPVLFQLLGRAHQSGFIVWCAICSAFALLAVVALRRRPVAVSKLSSPWTVAFRFVLGVATLAAIVHWGRTGGTGGLREGALALTLMVLSSLKRQQVRLFIQYVGVVLCGWLAVSVCALVIAKEFCVVGDWNVNQLAFISDANPVFGRGDFDYWAMPHYLTVIPYEATPSEIAFGYRAQRYPLIFSEATFVWAALLPFLLISISPDQPRWWRLLITLVASTALVLCPGVWGVLVSGGVVWLCATGRLSPKSSIVLSFVVPSCVVLTGAIAPEWFIGSLGGNKLDQWKTYSSVVDVGDHLSAWGTPSAQGLTDEKHSQSYGQLFVLQRFGLLGAFVWAAWTSFGLALAWHTHFLGRRSQGLRACSLALFASILMSLKSTILISPWVGLFALVGCGCHQRIHGRQRCCLRHALTPVSTTSSDGSRAP
jgi:hypothetical protein